MDDAPKRRPTSAPIALLVLIILVAGGSFWGWRWWRARVLERNEAAAIAGLKQLAVAEADFRSNDRDNNRINDFWTADVASLFYLSPVSGGSSIQLIENALAGADGIHPRCHPFRGYLFRAMETDETGTSYAQNGRNPSKFGFCAYPAVYGRTGRFTFIINELNTVFRTDTEGKPILRFPSDPVLKQDYGRPD